MRNSRFVLAAVAFAAPALFLAAPAQAYPDFTVSIVATTPVIGGQEDVDFTVEAQNASVDCDWTVTFLGSTKTGSGQTFSGTFETDEVPSSIVKKMSATCDADTIGPVSASAGDSSDTLNALYVLSDESAVQAAAFSASASTNVTILPLDATDNAGDGELPGTGGSNLSWLLLGGALLVAGGGVTLAARRRELSR